MIDELEVYAALGEEGSERLIRTLDEVRLPAEADAVLRRFFEATATFMINRG